MQTSVTFKNLDPSDNLKSYVGNKLDRFDRFLDNPAEAKVVLSIEKFRHTAEINIVGDRLKVKGKEETNDMYSAIDIVLDKLEKQIKKIKQKIKDKHKDRRSTKNASAINLNNSPGPDDDEPKEIIITNIDYKPMDIDEAVMQMEMSNNAFLVFTNAKTDRLNVLYHRNDGNYGVIQPNH